MKAKELRNLDKSELERKERDLGGEIMNLYFQRHMGQLKNTMRVRQVRRSLARVKTVLKEKN